jgi:fatty acid desaturase
MGRRRNANIWFGRVVGTLVIIPYSAYRETHIRHHAYMNTPDDYELWPYSSPSASLAFRRAFVLFELFGGVVSEPIIYGRIFFFRKSPLSKQARRTIRREYQAMAAFWGAIGLLLVALTISGTIDWRGFDPLWLVPFPIAAGINAMRKFVEHLGMESTEPLTGTRTILGNNRLTRLCSYFNFELSIHGPHHRFPKAPHFELESKLAEYQRAHPHAVVPVFTTYRAAVLDTIPCLWRNPGVGANAVKQARHQAAAGDPVQNASPATAAVPDQKTEYLLPPGVDNFTSEVGGLVPEPQVKRAA